jgi:hypothetical protein
VELTVSDAELGGTEIGCGMGSFAPGAPWARSVRRVPDRGATQVLIGLALALLDAGLVSEPHADTVWEA